MSISQYDIEIYNYSPNAIISEKYDCPHNIPFQSFVRTDDISCTRKNCPQAIPLSADRVDSARLLASFAALHHAHIGRKFRANDTYRYTKAREAH